MNEDLDTLISRRTLLKGAAAAACVAIASTFVGKAFAEKSSKAAVKYQDKPNGDMRCSNCSFFIPGKTSTADGACQVVEGAISPQGYCIMYVKKS